MGATSANLFNKYRPTKFSDIAQPHVTRVLIASILAGDFASTYLFSGFGGTGKTTVARVFAMALLCENRKDDESEPCGTCSCCRMIREDTHRDVVEINCATHGKAEEVRALIAEEIMLAPAFGRFRVFILDEAQVLSATAQDSLLKIFEEPPAHVIFCLCTTDPDKLKKTIRTRCQRHRLKRVTDRDLRSILENVVKEEGIQAETAALELIISEAQGSARQALSTLEQVKLIGASEENVREVLGRAPRQMAVELLLAIADGQEGYHKSFKLTDTAQEEGHDLTALLEECCRILASVARYRLFAIEVDDQSEALRPLVPLFAGSTLIETVNSLTEIIARIRQNVPADLACQFGVMTTIQRYARAKANAIAARKAAQEAKAEKK